MIDTLSLWVALTALSTAQGRARRPECAGGTLSVRGRSLGRACGLTLLALLCAPTSGAQVTDPGVAERPGQRMLEEMRHRASGRQVWLTSPAGRVRATIGEVNENGLTLKKVAAGQLQEPSIVWSEVVRLELIRSRRTAGRVLGTTIGATLGGVVGSTSTHARSYNDASTLAGIAVGAISGFFVGGRLGARLEHTELLYARPAHPNEAPTRPADPERALYVTAAPKPEMRAGQRVRLWTDGTAVEGQLVAADAGVVVLEAHTRSPGPDEPSAPISWSQIQSVEVRTSRAGWGAIVGGVALGVLGAAAGGVLSQGLWDSPDQGAVIGGAAGGALLGAGLGCVVGSLFKSWKPVYVAP